MKQARTVQNLNILYWPSWPTFNMINALTLFVCTLDLTIRAACLRIWAQLRIAFIAGVAICCFTFDVCSSPIVVIGTWCAVLVSPNTVAIFIIQFWVHLYCQWASWLRRCKSKCIRDNGKLHGDEKQTQSPMSLSTSQFNQVSIILNKQTLPKKRIETSTSMARQKQNHDHSTKKKITKLV